MGYYYNIALCDFDPAEDNYEEFLNMESSRQALHVGNLDFPNQGDVYFSMIQVFIYDGNFDIICNHSGVLDMINDLKWSGSNAYSNADREVYYYNREVVGYLTKADNLNLLVVRNAGHMVPLSQPPYAQQMIEEFTSGSM